MQILQVSSKAQMSAFVHFPRQQFKNERCYVPPIWLEERSAYNGKHNPILMNADFALFIVLDETGSMAGRNLVYIDHNYNRHYGAALGFFGAFECRQDPQAGQLLIRAAEDWLRQRGITAMRGPIHPVAENWGFVAEGYERPPVYMSPWNPPYYHGFFADAGYRKAKDLLVYEADSGRGYRMPDRFNRFYDHYFERYPNIRIRRLNMKSLHSDAKAIWEISNEALAQNWGYVPLELPVMEDMLRKLKLIVDPDAVWIVEDSGEAVGYCLGFPDINVILKQTGGRMLPLGWARLIFGARRQTDYRLFGLAVRPAWQRKALDTLMYINLYRHLAPRGVRLEANYILEDNLNIKNALEKLGLTHIKTYRIYEKSLV